MPADAPPSFFGRVPYAWTVLQARRAHAAALRQLLDQEKTEQDQLEEALRDLGKALRASKTPSPVATLEIDALLSVETRRAEAAQSQAGLETNLKAIEARFEEANSAAQTNLSTAKREIQRLDGEVSAQQERHRHVTRQGQDIDRRLKRLERERDDAQAQAAKTEDIAEREVLTRSAAEYDVQAEDLHAERKRLDSTIAEVAGPLAEGEAALKEAHNQAKAAQKAIDDARRQGDIEKREISEAQRAQGMELTRLDQEIAGKLLAVGAAVDAARIDDASFDEIYSRIDGLRDTIAALQAQQASIATNRDDYDHGAFRAGLIIAGGAGGGLLLLVLILAFVLA